MYYKVRKEGQNAVALREVKKTMAIFGAVLVFFMIFLAILLGNVFLHFAVKLFFGMLLVGGLITMTTYGHQTNMANAMRIYVDKQTIARVYSEAELGGFTKFSMSYNEGKHGTRATQMIPVHQIASITFGKKSIVVKSNDYNWFNSNGRIEIPQEMEQYQLIKATLLTLPIPTLRKIIKT